jgi:hypothetical protein
MKHTKDNNLRFIGEVFIPEMGRTSIPWTIVKNGKF